MNVGEKGVPLGLNGVLTHDRLKGMLEGKGYCAVEILFPFMTEFSDRCIGRVENLVRKNMENR